MFINIRKYTTILQKITLFAHFFTLFKNKPSHGYICYIHKMSHYVSIIIPLVLV